MSKSRARLLAELLNTEGRVKKDRSDLAGADSVIDLDNLPTITNAKLENSSITIAGEALSLGGTLSLNTGHITEHTDYKYYTDTRARAAISVDGNLSYNSTTGVVSFTERTDAEVRGLVSASGSLSYNSSTGVFSYTTPTTIASLSNHDTDDLAEGTNLYFTNARARAAVSASTGSAGYTSSTGVFTIPSTSDHITEGSNQFFTNARARGAISASGSLSYNSSTGVISYTQPTNISTFTNDSSYITNATASLNADKITAGVLNHARIPIPANGDWWNNGFVKVQTDGVMEVGKYLDFHTADSGGGTDYDVRITASSGAIDIDGDLTVDDITAGAISATSYSGTLASSVTGTTQSASDNSTKVATTAYVDSAVSGLVDSAPGTLNTLNELAAALGDDANFSTTVTNSIATKLPLAGGTITGRVTFPTGSSTKPILAEGFYARTTGDTSGTHDIWGISGQYYPSASSAADQWGIQWSGTPNEINFIGAGQKKLSIDLDTAGLVKIDNNKVWHEGNDGTGSGLDADYLDGIQGSQLLRSDANDSFTGNSLSFPTLSFSINNNNGAGSYDAYLRGTSSHLVLGMTSGNTFYNNYGNSSGEHRIYGNMYHNDTNIVNIWGSGNDGSGSGLDADLLDGVQGASFLRSDAADTGAPSAATALTLGYIQNNKIIIGNGTTSFTDVYNDSPWYGIGRTNVDGWYSGQDKAQMAFYWGLVLRSGQSRIELGPASNGPIQFGDGATTNWAKINSTGIYQGTSNLVWHAGNDGAGSGLDADLLDGLQGSSYWQKSGSWYGDLGSNGYDRVQGVNYTGGEFVLVEKNAQMSTLIDGDYFAYESGGFFSSSSSAYGDLSGFKAYNTDTIQVQQKDGGNANLRVTGSITRAGNTVWDSGNDGSGSGLDADYLDGIQGSQFLRSDAGDTHTGGTITLGSGSSIDASSNDRYLSFRVIRNAGTANLDGMYIGYGNSGSGHTRLFGGGATTGGLYIRGSGANDLTYGNNTGVIWHSANDGSGTGLDADTVDGLQASQFLRADNVTDEIAGDFALNNKTGNGWSIHGSYFTQLLYTGNLHGGNTGYVFDPLRYKTTSFWGRSGSTWTNLGNANAILDGRWGAQFGGLNLSRSYDEFIIYFGSELGYTIGNGLILQHSTNGNSFDVYFETKESVTNAYESGFTTEFSQTGISSWPGGTVIRHNWAVGASYRDNLRIRIVPNWSTTYPNNTITLGGLSSIAAYGSATPAYYTDFDKTFRVEGPEIYANGNKVWHAGNDGASSGLDADTVDSLHATSFLRSDANDTASGQYSFTKTNDHAIKVGTIRGTAVGNQSGEYIHMYERVHIGGPSGWGASVSAAPSYGISTYGGADLAVNQGTVRVTTGSIASSDASTRGLLMDGNYTNGQYRHRWRKQDAGGGVPLYLDYAAGTANSYTQIARFGPYTSNPEQFEVYGAMKTNGQIVINQNIASPSNYYNGLQMEVRATSGTAGIGLHRNGYSHVGIYTNSTNRLDFDFNSGDVIMMYNAGTLWGSGNDGSGSGLDADTVDGIQGSSIIQTGTNFGGDVSGTYNAIVVANNSHEHSQLYENAGITYGASYLQWLDNNGTGGTGLNGSSPANGFSDWHHHLVMNHANSGGYYSNLQCSFHSDRIHYRRLVNGSLQGAVELFHTGNDGSGSGLDADLLDGQHKAYFEMPTSPFTQNGNMNNVSAPAGQYASVQFYNMYTPSGSGNQSNYNVPEDGGSHYHVQQFNGYSNSYNNWKYQIAHSFYNGKMYHRNQYDTTWQGWATVWDSDTDGAGSGLDADLLDGQQGSYYNWRTWNSHITWNNAININVAGESSIDVSGSGYFQVWDSGTGAPFIKCDVGQTVEIGQAGSRGLYVYGSITASGNVTAYSDIRLKENIEVIPNALEKVNQIRGVTFTRNDQDDKERRHAGVIAQEVEQVLPEVVDYNEEKDVKTVSYGNMVGLLIEAIKELKQEVDDLKAQLKEK